MALTLWEPVMTNGERQVLSTLQRLLGEQSAGHSGEAAMDVLETENQVLVKLSLPGSTREAFDVTFKQQVLTIRAEVPADVEEGARYLLRERFHGKVERSVQLPWDVNIDEAEAAYSDGVLTLKLPKAETARPRSIQVR